MTRPLDSPSPPNAAPPGPRPWWMTALAVVCFVALVVNVPRDLFFAETRDLEVWLGLEVTGLAAWLTAPIHWAIFATGAWGFWKLRSWALPCAAAYLFYVAVSHLVWSELSANGRGWPIGVVQAAGLSAAAFVLLRGQRSLFGARRGQPDPGRGLSGR